jgi:hypothetical protein
VSQLNRQCPECGVPRLFEQPHGPGACPDAADGCPERACTVCGTALLVGFVRDRGESAIVAELSGRVA